MFTIFYKSVEIIVSKRGYLEIVKDWFDSLEENEIKDHIRKIRCKELKPSLDRFRLVVICQHPDQADVETLLKAQGESKQKDAVAQIMETFQAWIKRHWMPTETELNKGLARIYWYPLEVPAFDTDGWAPQDSAQFELEGQAITNLGLIDLTAQGETLFMENIKGSNTPFVAAGAILSGHWDFIAAFPETFPNSQSEKDSLYENIEQNTADYVVLMRLAGYMGCKLPLVRRVLEVCEDFQNKYAEHLDEWVIDYGLFLDDLDHFFNIPLNDESYTLLDTACDEYRQSLIKATEGHEHELAKAINSFLTNLPIPEMDASEDIEEDEEDEE